MTVAGTNLIGYYFIQGPFTRLAEAVLAKDPDWAAPLLWRSAFRSVLWQYLKAGTFDVLTAAETAAKAEDLLREHEFEVPSAGVLSLAASSGCSPYDCECVHLARANGWSLVTADRKILTAFPGTATSLEDFTR